MEQNSSCCQIIKLVGCFQVYIFGYLLIAAIYQLITFFFITDACLDYIILGTMTIRTRFIISIIWQVVGSLAHLIFFGLRIKYRFQNNHFCLSTSMVLLDIFIWGTMPVYKVIDIVVGFSSIFSEDMQSISSDSDVRLLAVQYFGASIFLILLVIYLILLFKYARMMQQVEVPQDSSSVQIKEDELPEYKKRQQIEKDPKQQICTICLQKESNLAFKCKHHFHVQCFNQWKRIHRSCPNCKSLELRNYRIYCRGCYTSYEAYRERPQKNIDFCQYKCFECRNNGIIQEYSKQQKNKKIKKLGKIYLL